MRKLIAAFASSASAAPPVLRLRAPLPGKSSTTCCGAWLASPRSRRKWAAASWILFPMRPIFSKSFLPASRAVRFPPSCGVPRISFSCRHCKACGESHLSTIRLEILVCDNGYREPVGTVRAGNREIQTPIAGLVLPAETRPSLAKNKRTLPYLAFRNHAATDARCRGRSLL